MAQHQNKHLRHNKTNCSKKNQKETIKPTSNVDAYIVIPSSKPLKKKK
jgi:hypothetical protein